MHTHTNVSSRSCATKLYHDAEGAYGALRGDVANEHEMEEHSSYFTFPRIVHSNISFTFPSFIHANSNFFENVVFKVCTVFTLRRLLSTKWWAVAFPVDVLLYRNLFRQYVDYERKCY